MNRKHRRTLDAVFANPVSPAVRWSDVEGLFRALGAHIEERAGSRVAIELNGQVAVFHRPHPSPNTDRGAVKSVRQFLTRAGVRG